MSEFLVKMFRGEPDGWSLKLLSTPHIILMVIIFSTAILVWKKHRYFQTHDILRKPLAITLFLQFTLLYTWYAISGYTGIRESLPLYNCRLAIILTTVALLTKNKFCRLVACYWGLAGGTLAVVLPSMDPFSWPHYTQISFTVGHFSLLIAILYMIAVDKPKFDLDSLKTILIFSTVYHAAVAVLDYALDTNYCYLKKFPFCELPFVASETIAYTLFAIAAHNFVLVLVHMALKGLERRRDHFIEKPLEEELIKKSRVL